MFSLLSLPDHRTCQTWASGLEALLTRPLGWALAPARLAPRGVLGGLGAGSGEWVAALSPSRLAGAAVARITGAGPLAIHPLPTPSGSQVGGRCSVNGQGCAIRGALQGGALLRARAQPGTVCWHTHFAAPLQTLYTFKPLRMLPGMSLRISPAIFCAQPQ